MAEESQGDRFVHLTDLHFWEIVRNPFALMNKRALGAMNVLLRRRKEFLIDRAGAYAAAVAGTGIQDVVITGDLTSTATEREFEMGVAFVQDLERRGLRVSVIPGNHDVYTFESVRTKRFERHFGPWMPGESLPTLQTLPGGTPILYVPTVCANLLSSRGRITDAEYRCVAELLEGASSPVVVAGHYPLLDRTYGYDAGAGRRLRGAAALYDVLGASGVTILYLCGHVHRFSLVRCARHATITHLTTGAFFRHDRRSSVEGEFAAIRCDGTGFQVRRHLFEGEWRASE